MQPQKLKINYFVQLQAQYQMHQNTYLLTLFLLLIILQISNASNFPLTANEKYSYAGKLSVNIDQQITNKDGTNWLGGLILTVVYPRSYNYNLNLSVVAVIGDFGYHFSSGDIFIIVDDIDHSQSSLKIQIITDQASQISKLSINYFIFLQEEEDWLNYGYYKHTFSPEVYPVMLSYNESTWLNQIISVSQFNFTNDSRCILMLSALNGKSAYQKAFDLFLEASLINSTAVRIKIGSLSQQTYINQFSSRIFLYNSGFRKEAAISYQFLDGKLNTSMHNNGTYLSTGEQIKIFNTIYGLSALSAPYDASIDLAVNLVGGTQIFAFSNGPINSFTYSFISIFSKYCDYRTPYYKQDSGQCYAQCPETSESHSELKCGCYDDNGLFTISSNCSISNTKYIIIGTILGAALLIIILVIIYRCCKRQNNRPNYQQDQIRVRIDFVNPTGQFINQSNENIEHFNTENDDIKIQQRNQTGKFFIISDNQRIQEKQVLKRPIYHSIKKLEEQAQSDQKQKNKSKDDIGLSPFTISSQNDQKDKIEKKYVKRQVNDSKDINDQCDFNQNWVSCLKYDGNNMCTICRNSQSYLQTQCGHYFHAQCLTKWMEKNAICPNCNQIITNKFKYYCNRCGEKQRDTDFTKPSEVIFAKLVCDECADIPV